MKIINAYHILFSIRILEVSVEFKPIRSGEVEVGVLLEEDYFKKKILFMFS